MKGNEILVKRIFKNYLVTKDGEVYSILRKRYMKKQMSCGYYRVQLYYDGISKKYLVHRLVWMAFNGEIPKGMEVNHINEDKTDNRLENLNLMTKKQNINWGTANNRRGTNRSGVTKEKPIIQYTMDGQKVKEWKSGSEITRTTEMNGSVILKCCAGRFKSMYGYKWVLK